MAIVCKECNKGVCIAKFYPSGGFIAGDGSGWYTNGDKHEKIDAFFEKHQHDFDDPMWGGWQYEIRYEQKAPEGEADNSWEYESI